jgi:hypothetical protein
MVVSLLGEGSEADVVVPVIEYQIVESSHRPIRRDELVGGHLADAAQMRCFR